MKKHTCSPLAPPRLTLAPPGASGGTLPDENVSKNIRKKRVGEHRHTNKFHESVSKNIRKNMSEHYSHSNEFPRNTHETNVHRRFFTVPLRCAPKLLARRSGRRPPGYFLYIPICLGLYSLYIPICHRLNPYIPSLLSPMGGPMVYTCPLMASSVLRVSVCPRCH